jgi:chitinase domain-containing protein 1
MLSSTNSFVFVCLLLVSEATIGPGSRKTTSRSTDKESMATAASAPAPSMPAHPSQTSTPSKINVLQRQLVDENITPKSIVDNYQSYCSTCLQTREFTQSTLVYVTPWNSHGYDMAKLFTKKFDYISPVWFNIKRTGLEKYHVEGVHNIDEKWLEKVKENNPQVRIVPRVIFENWPVDHIHALFQSENEKQRLASTLSTFLTDYQQWFDGYVLELLLQFRGASKPAVHHIISDIAERVHQLDNDGQRKEIILAVPPHDELFNEKDFELLNEHIDGISVMTYDFPNREPGPVAPLGK